jgi:6-phosphofructokinase 2
MNIVTVTLNPCVDKTLSVERVVADRKLAGEDVHEYPGGGGINVARVITRLGGDALALWSCGGDMGSRLARLLDAERLSHLPVPIEGEVRENVIVTDRSTGEQYRFGMPGPRLSEAERLRWIETLRGLPVSTEYVVVSGGLPDAAPGDWYGDLLRALPKGARVIVDSKQEALRRALEVGVYLIKPNLRELEEIVGRQMSRDEEIQRAAREIIERRGAEAVLVSLGRGGAILVTAREMDHFTTPPVPVRSKVGAGDSMVGGLTAALAEKRPLEEAVRFGVAAGAAAVMNEGTELCRREDAEQLFQSVRRQACSA